MLRGRLDSAFGSGPAIKPRAAAAPVFRRADRPHISAAGGLTAPRAAPIVRRHTRTARILNERSEKQSQEGHDVDRARGRGDAHRQGQPRLPRRRLGLHLPRLPRAAAADAAVGRAAGRCRARVLRHAVEALARDEGVRGADPFRRHLRRVGEDLPQRDLRGLQGPPSAAARKSSFRSSRSSATQ